MYCGQSMGRDAQLDVLLENRRPTFKMLEERGRERGCMG